MLNNKISLPKITEPNGSNDTFVLTREQYAEILGKLNGYKLMSGCFEEIKQLCPIDEKYIAIPYYDAIISTLKDRLKNI